MLLFARSTTVTLSMGVALRHFDFQDFCTTVEDDCCSIVLDDCCNITRTLRVDFLSLRRCMLLFERSTTLSIGVGLRHFVFQVEDDWCSIRSTLRVDFLS